MRKIWFRTVTLIMVILVSIGFVDGMPLKLVSPIKAIAVTGTENINSRIVDGDTFLVDGKKVLGLSYTELVRIWGEPRNIIRARVKFPATVEYQYMYIVLYKDIAIEMYPCEKDVPVKKTTSFRFDITGKTYDFYGKRIGMSLSDYQKTVENKRTYRVKDVLKEQGGGKVPFEYEKLLKMLKPKDWYGAYSKDLAMYEQVIIKDAPYGAVMVFRNKTLVRIIYGYPNAS